MATHCNADYLVNKRLGVQRDDKYYVTLSLSQSISRFAPPQLNDLLLQRVNIVNEYPQNQREEAQPEVSLGAKSRCATVPHRFAGVIWTRCSMMCVIAEIFLLCCFKKPILFRVRKNKMRCSHDSKNEHIAAHHYITHPLQGTCALPNPAWIDLHATPKISRLAPKNTFTSLTWKGPTLTRVKNIFPTTFVPNFSIRRPRGTERRRKQKKGMGKKIHITWPHVIIEPAMLEILWYKFINRVRRMDMGSVLFEYFWSEQMMDTRLGQQAARVGFVFMGTTKQPKWASLWR